MGVLDDPFRLPILGKLDIDRNKFTPNPDLPTAYLTKEGEVVPAKKDVVAALNQLAAETDRQTMPALPWNSATRREVLNAALKDALTAVRKVYVEATMCCAAAERERDEAQLEVERLTRELLEMKAQQRREAGYFTAEEVDRMGGQGQ